MAESQVEDVDKTPDTFDNIAPPKEHGSLGYLLSQIPKRAQKGLLVQCDLIMTSMDANHEYIVIGSNVGVFFLYDRKKTLMERLKTGSNNDVISCVKLHHGLEHQVAAGTTKGSVHIFQLPSLMPGQNKQLQKFQVSDIHKSSLTCLSWSLNGMKLFSGDKKGVVVCTEADFYQGQCQSAVLMTEKDTEIIQLHHAHKSLLVSTHHRSVVCRTDDNNQLVQIGQKDRKIPGSFGGVFIPALCKTEDAELYAVRPGMRIWKASINGTVQNTYLFKELINAAHPQILLSYNETASTKKSTSESQFGCLLLYLDRYLLTWNQMALYILNPDNHLVIGSQTQIGTIVDVAVTEDEIFVLRTNTGRNLIRIAAKPENTESVYEKLLHEKRLADAAAHNLKTTEISSDIKSTTTSSSPFKFFQTNIVDKLKNLEVTQVTKTDSRSITHLKESMDKFGHVDSDTCDEEELHHHGHYYDPSNITNDTPPEIKPLTELKEELPPIVTLQSPDLLTIEVFSGIPSNVSKALQPMSPGSERFNPFLKDNLSDFEDDHIQKSEDPNSNQREDNSVYLDMVSADKKSDIADGNENRNEKFEMNTPDVSDNSTNKLLMDRLKTEVLDTGGDIVFSSKHKQRKVKKRKGHKHKHDRLKVEDEDKLSIASAESIESDSPKVDREFSKDSDSVSLQSDISDKSAEIQSNQSGSSSPKTSSETSSPQIIVETSSTNKQLSHSHSTPKKHIKQKSKDTKDMFSKMEENLESLEGFERHLTTLPNKDHNYETYLKNFENRAGRQQSLNLESEKNETTERPRSRSDGSAAISVNETVTNITNDKESSDRHIEHGSSAREESDNKFKEKDAEESESKDEKIEHNPIQVRTERSISVEESIYTVYKKQNSVDESEQLKGDNSSPRVDSSGSETNTQIKKDSYYKTPDSSLDDFYQKFGSTHSNLSSLDGEEVPPPGSKSMEPSKNVSDFESSSEVFSESKTAPSYKLVNNWTEIVTSGNLVSLALSQTHIWFTDRSSNLYYSSLTGTGIKWQKVNCYAKQIAVSRSGFIVWRLYKDTVYAGTKITPKRPEGLKWVDAVREVQYITVDDSCAWYIKTSGEILVQRGLSKDRPCYKATKVPCDYKLKQIICRRGVVWGLTEEYSIVYRSGITKSNPLGTEWKPLHEATQNLFTCITFGEGHIAWAIDVLGRVCLTNNVTLETPTGEGKWWQVPMSEILVQDVTAVDALRSLAKKFDPQKLAYIMSTTRSGLVAAGSGGVWVCPEFKNVLQICRGSIEGHFWDEINLAGFSPSVVWKNICASSSEHQYGLVWLQQPNGDLFTFSPDSAKCNMVSQPLNGKTFTRLSTCKDSTWGLTADGQIYIRSGIGANCPQGTDWTSLDITQLGEAHLIHLSCGSQCIWAVDSDGIVYQRLGVKAPTSHSLPSVWLPVDSEQTGTIFTQVTSGPKDWMVWALDNRRQVYARIGITETMPIGTEWVHVPGTPATQLTVSNDYVWALNPNGEILCRYGVTRDNPGGDYWRQIPGIFIQISTSPTDRLWGISRDGKIFQRLTKYLLRQHTSDDFLLSDIRRQRSTPSVASDDGWELV